MESQELIPHLFRTEFRKITAVLVKRLGIDHLELAEDIASETFLAAMESWPYNGLPAHPTAWLYTVAKNKATNHIKRNQLFRDRIAPEIKEGSASSFELDIDLSDQNITDSQLQLLFAIAHPVLAIEAQVGLALRLLCGFGIEEIADAFLSNKETISKRLFRAREKLRMEKVKIEVPSAAEIQQRLDTVLTTLYLLFNEGYYSESGNEFLRKELCWEAIRLTRMLIDNPLTNQPRVYALLSLLYFQSSRLDARVGPNGEMVLYQDQDTSLWNQELIRFGGFFLHQAATGTELSKYHLEAAIAYWHTVKEDQPDKWKQILDLFDQLMLLDPSPYVLLNRAYAIFKTKGAEAAIDSVENLRWTSNHFFNALMGELYGTIDQEKAKYYFQLALETTRTPGGRTTIQKKIDML